jgi:hypothetical protein
VGYDKVFYLLFSRVAQSRINFLMFNSIFPGGLASEVEVDSDFSIEEDFGGVDGLEDSGIWVWNNITRNRGL